MNTSKTDHNMMNGWKYWYLVQGSRQVPYCIKSKWNMMHVPTRIYSLSWGNVIKPGRARERERVVAIECFPKSKIKSSLLHRWVAAYWNETTGDTAHVPACVFGERFVLPAPVSVKWLFVEAPHSCASVDSPLLNYGCSGASTHRPPRQALRKLSPAGMRSSCMLRHCLKPETERWWIIDDEWVRMTSQCNLPWGTLPDDSDQERRHRSLSVHACTDFVHNYM